MADNCFTNGVFPPNWLCLGFLNHWCYLVNQPAFSPVLSRIMVNKDTSSTEGVAQYTGTYRTRRTHFDFQ